MYYLDACVFVAALTPEDRSMDVDKWLFTNQTAGFYYSDWVTTEVSAALSVKVLLKTIHPAQRASAMAQYVRLVGGTCERIDITARHFERATRVAEAYDTGIRAGDALHVAVCLLETRLRLCTLDKKLGLAGPKLGVQTVMV